MDREQEVNRRIREMAKIEHRYRRSGWTFDEIYQALLDDERIRAEIEDALDETMR